MNKQNEYPKVMEVSSTPDFEDYYTRVVFAEKNGKYLAWSEAETIEKSEKVVATVDWGYAREIDPYKELKEAFEEGEIIQVNEDIRGWIDIKFPKFICNPSKYRIKPEPEYIPFDFSDADKLIGKTVKGEDSGEIHIVTSIYLNGVSVNNNFQNFSDLLSYFTFLDGSICGKLNNE